MNLSFIELLAGKATAEKIQNESYFEDHIAGDCETLNGDDLDDLTRGATVLGVEPVTDPPLLCGVIIYLKTQPGELVALWIEANEKTKLPRNEPPLLVSRARLP